MTYRSSLHALCRQLLPFCLSTCYFFPLSGMPVFSWFMPIHFSGLSMNITFSRKSCQSSVEQGSSVCVLHKVPPTTELIPDSGTMNNWLVLKNYVYITHENFMQHQNQLSSQAIFPAEKFCNRENMNLFE